MTVIATYTSETAVDRFGRCPHTMLRNVRDAKSPTRGAMHVSLPVIMAIKNGDQNELRNLPNIGVDRLGVDWSSS
jgi:hypothetical protein